MSMQEIHFIRDALVKDYQGVESSVMEVSLSNSSSLHPKFQQAAFYETLEVRALYTKLGGSRRAEDRRGSTVIIPNRSRWASLRGISAEEVQVVQELDSQERDGSSGDLHTSETRARDRMMRD
jgi:hypothetical protein